MAEEYLEIAFEIKAMCDELSRKLLQWHWEGCGHGKLPQLLEYVAQRTKQAPDYFGNLPQHGKDTVWQQLDTTWCMRVLLDPGDNPGNAGGTPPIRFLADAKRPGGARHACNGLRVARNAAAHATDLYGTAQAVAAFTEAVEDLEESYEENAISRKELDRYRKAARRAVAACAEGKKPQQKQPAQEKSAPKKPSGNKTAKAADDRKQPVSRQRSESRGGTAEAAQRRGNEKPSVRKNSPKKRSGNAAQRKKQEAASPRWGIVLAAVVVLLALLLRGKELGIF